MGIEVLEKCQRLDLAARALTIDTLLARLRIIGVLLSCILLVAALVSTPPPRETLAGRILAAVVSAFIILLWLNLRYVLQITALLLLVAGGAYLLFPNTGRSGHIYLTSQLALFVGIVSLAYSLFKAGIWLAAVRGEGWKAERLAVRRWLDLMRDLGEEVIEFPARSFREGELSYRLLKVDDGWALAVFGKSGLRKGLVQYRIWPVSAVDLTGLKSGRVSLQIDGRTVSGVVVSPESEAAFLRLTQSA